MTGILQRYGVLSNIIRLVLIVGIISLFVWYVFFQARLVIAGPSLMLMNEPGITHHERAITISGKAENVIAISLNGRPVFTDDDGNFTESLVLENGYTIMTMVAEDRFGRQASLERSFVYIPGT